MSSEWQDPSDVRPVDGEHVEWLDSSGATKEGTYSRGLWFLGDMYIYYEPTFWRHREEATPDPLDVALDACDGEIELDP